MAETTYRQCELRRPSTGEFEVAWMPVSFAVAGKWVRIGDDPVSWKVTEVYRATNLTAEDMIRRRENLKRFQWALGE